MPILVSPNSAASKDIYDVKNNDKWGYKFLIEHIVGKEEIARYEQFLFFTQCFQKLCVVDALK